MRLSGAAIDVPPAGIGGRIEHAAEPGKPLHDGGAHRGRVLADAGREHEGVETAERRRQQAGLQADAVDEIVEREARARICARLEFAHVVADAGQALQSALVIEQVLHLLGAHLLFPDQVEHHAGIDLAGPRAHRQPVERREAHRALDAAAVRKRAHRSAAAEMRDDHPAGRDLGRDLLQPARRCTRRTGRGSRSGARPRRRSVPGSRSGRPAHRGRGETPCRSRRPAAARGGGPEWRGSVRDCSAGAAAPARRGVRGWPAPRRRSEPAGRSPGRHARRGGRRRSAQACVRRAASRPRATMRPERRRPHRRRKFWSIRIAPSAALARSRGMRSDAVDLALDQALEAASTRRSRTPGT